MASSSETAHPSMRRFSFSPAASAFLAAGTMIRRDDDA